MQNCFFKYTLDLVPWILLAPGHVYVLEVKHLVCAFSVVHCLVEYVEGPRVFVALLRQKPWILRSNNRCSQTIIIFKCIFKCFVIQLFCSVKVSLSFFKIDSDECCLNEAWGYFAVKLFIQLSGFLRVVLYLFKFGIFDKNVYFVFWREVPYVFVTQFLLKHEPSCTHSSCWLHCGVCECYEFYPEICVCLNFKGIRHRLLIKCISSHIFFFRQLKINERNPSVNVVI